MSFCDRFRFDSFSSFFTKTKGLIESQIFENSFFFFTSSSFSHRQLTIAYNEHSFVNIGTEHRYTTSSNTKSTRDTLPLPSLPLLPLLPSLLNGFGWYSIISDSHTNKLTNKSNTFLCEFFSKHSPKVKKIKLNPKSNSKHTSPFHHHHHTQIVPHTQPLLSQNS